MKPRLVRSFGWYPIRALDFTCRARCLPTLLTQDDPGYERKMLARLARMYVDVRWPTTGLHRYCVGADFAFAATRCRDGVRFLFACTQCQQAGRTSWRTQVRFIHPTEVSSWCGRCLFGVGGDGDTAERPCGLDLDYQAAALAGIAAYRMEEIRGALTELKNKYAPYVGAPERA